MSILFCITFSIILLSLVYRGKMEFSNIILLGFILRVILMIIDLNHIFPILHSGADSESFHRIALQNSITGDDYTRTNYTPFLTAIYSMFKDRPRLVAQFINVLFGTSVLIIVRRCMQLCNVPYKIKKVVMWILALMPNFMIFSAILLREAWIEFFIALSLLFFIKWFLHKGNNIINITMSIACVFGAAYMHSGVIAVAIGYMLAFIMYRQTQQKIKFSVVSIIFIAVAIAAISVYMANLDTLGGKFVNIEEVNDEFIEEQLEGIESRGDSAYLQWLNVSSPAVGFAVLPLRMFYFLFSPIPFDWRGLNDIIAFVFDGLIYLFLIPMCIRAKIEDKVMKNMRIFLLTSVFLTSLIFSVGTFTAGTAIRHRAKFLSVVAVAYAISQTGEKNDNNKKRLRWRL